MSLRERIETEVNAAGWWIIAEVLTAPAQILALLVVRLLRPVFLVQTACLEACSIGGLAAKTDLALLEISLQGRKAGRRTKVFWYLPEQRVSNEFLLNLIKPRTTIVPRWMIIVAVRLNKLIPGGNVHDCTHSGRDTKNLLDRTGPQFHLSIAETKSGNQKLADIGIPVGAKFVCLNVRDSAYNKTTQPRKDWQFFDYRNCAIENYVAAAEELTRRGYYVFRMGAVVESPLSTSNPMIIDYASNGMRSDFMDIFLGANCEFCISNGTGFDGVPYIFRRPILYVNHVPIGWLVSYSDRFIVQTKMLIWTETGDRLTLRENFRAGLGFGKASSDYSEAGVSIIENTSQENVDAVTEMVDRIEGKWIETPASIGLQQKFWATYESCLNPEERAFHGEFRAHYVSSALEKDPGWLD